MGPADILLVSALEEDQDGTLVIHYVIHNGSPVAVVVFNRLPVYVHDRTPRYWSSTAYKEFDAGRLSVELMVLPVPADSEARGKPTSSEEWWRGDHDDHGPAPMPDVTLIEAGASIEGRVTLHEPVEVQDWYRCSKTIRALLPATAGSWYVASRRVRPVAPNIANTVSFSVEASVFTGSLSRSSFTYPNVYKPPQLAGDPIILTKELTPPHPLRVLTCAVSIDASDGELFE